MRLGLIRFLSDYAIRGSLRSGPALALVEKPEREVVSMADGCDPVRKRLKQLNEQLAKTEEFLPAGPKVKERVNPAWTRLKRLVEAAQAELQTCRESAQPLTPASAHVRLTKLHCYDENDGSGLAEPYLWVVFFKLDGETVTTRIEGNPLENGGANARLRVEGRATVIGHTSNHRNITEEDVDARDTVPIPPGLGAYETVLKPVIVSHPMLGEQPIMPGFIGCVAVLLEQDNTVHGPLAKGHRALNESVQRVIDELIVTIDGELAKVSLQDLKANPQRIKNEALALVNAALVTKQVEVQNKVLKAIKDDVLPWKWLAGAGDMDDQIGMLTVVYSQQQLQMGGKIIYGRFQKEGDWELWGEASATALAQTTDGSTTVSPGPERMNAIWRKSASDRAAVWSWARADFEKRGAELRVKGFALAQLNAFVLPDGREHFNAIWEKTSSTRPAVWGWARADFDKRAAELRAQGYQLRDLNAFVLPNGQGERFNAIWQKSAGEQTAVWGWARADFDKYAREQAAAGFRLRRVNAFVLPNGQGERFNAIWDKGGGERIAVWDYQRADFDRRERELSSQGYRLIDLNAQLPASGARELFNAVWERKTDDLVAVWGWTRADFDRRAAELSRSGFQLEGLSTFVL
jgi:hypothetical protein